MQEQVSPAGRVPVTVLTGFLGAGKTTLLNRWLGGYRPGEAAVLVNELGEVGIDGQLLHAPRGAIAELSDGCLCCAPFEGILEALARLATLTPRPRRLFIETSGLAEPGPVIESIHYGRLPSLLRLDAVVTVVDPVTLGARLGEAVLRQQIACADRVVLSRAEVATGAQLDEARARVAALNPVARVSLARRGELDEASEPEGWLAGRLRLLARAPRAPHAHAPGHEGDARATVLSLDGPLDRALLSAWLDALSQASGDALWRVKGIVALPASPLRWVAQGAGASFEIEAGAPWGDEPPASRLVVIGKQLDEDALRAGFARCAAG